MAAEHMGASCLRPNPLELGREWADLVAADKEQVERLREWSTEDHYQPVAHVFMADPFRQDDPILDALRAHASPDCSWLDVGAGAGRYALPLALASRTVVAVEPSEAMRQALEESSAEHQIDNVEVRTARWPAGAEGIEADFGLMAHVGYDVPEINPFIDALETATRERCFALMMDRVPNSGFDGFWEQVHGEPRVRLPAARELLHLLLARGSMPEVRVFPREPGEHAGHDIRQAARRRLWLSEGSDKDRQFQALLDEAPADADFQLPSVIVMLSWAPRSHR